MQAIRFAAALSLAAFVAAPALAQTADAPAAAAPAAPRVAPAGDTIETLRASGQFKILLRAFEVTNLTAVIKGQRSLTVFAPTDAAFDALGEAEVARLLADPAALQGLLVYHLVNTPVDSSKIAGARGPVQTVSGQGLVLDGTAGLKANDAAIVQADIRTPNGIVHVVDKVLTPAAAAAITARIEADARAAAEADAAAAAAPAQ
ncbi:MAG: fasciclin domain-containing protein [Pseudomonadota bacterium]